MSYTVIIPSKNPTNLMACLKALRTHEPYCPVVVVDDGLGQECVDQLVFFGPIGIVAGVKPFVFARNVNAGIVFAQSWHPYPYTNGYVILNDDALLESPRGFELLWSARYYKPNIGLIGATTNYTGQPLQHRRANGGLRIVPHIAFVCVYIPRPTIDAVGMLDERYCLDYGCEDADYCEAVTRAGLKIAVHDGCYVDHGKLTSSFRGRPDKAISFAQNYKLLILKWGKLESQK